MAEGKYLTYEECMELAKRHYNRGGDSFVECVDESMFGIMTERYGGYTKEKLLKEFATEYSIEQERRAMMNW